MKHLITIALCLSTSAMAGSFCETIATLTPETVAAIDKTHKNFNLTQRCDAERELAEILKRPPAALGMTQEQVLNETDAGSPAAIGQYNTRTVEFIYFGPFKNPLSGIRDPRRYKAITFKDNKVELIRKD